MSFGRFSHSDDERLVTTIRGLPIIFNHERFSTAKSVQLLRDNWKAVADAVGRNEEACKKRWRDIRDHYFKIKRKQLCRGSPISTKWPLFQKLYFLNNAKRKRRTPYDDCMFDLGQGISDAENSTDMYEPETTVKVEAELPDGESPSQMEYVMLPPPPDEPQPPAESTKDFFTDELNRRFALLTGMTSEAEKDDVDAFMRSIALTVKRFTPETRAEAKLKILSVVTQLEFPGRWHLTDCSKTLDHT